MKLGSQAYKFNFISTPEEYSKAQFLRHLKADANERRLFLAGHPLTSRFNPAAPLENSQRVGFKVRRFRSGEMTGAMFVTGRRSKIIPPARSGQIKTTGFTMAARQKIRRAVENSEMPLRYFLTLTFDPKELQGWEKDANDNVRHDFAKFRLHRFLDALTKHCQRRYKEKLLYIWVAELQKNGNIHFHLLINLFIPVGYTQSLWKHGNLDAMKLKGLADINHAVNYLRKYMTKDENAVIQGNRYNICKELRQTMKPIHDENIREMKFHEVVKGKSTHEDVLDIIHIMKEDIENQGGIVLDFGFNIPMPRRSRDYKCKKSGKWKKTKGVHKNLADNVYRLISEDEDRPF